MKDTYLHIRIDQETKTKLEQICKKEHRSQADQIAYWIQTYKEKTAN